MKQKEQWNEILAAIKDDMPEILSMAESIATRTRLVETFLKDQISNFCYPEIEVSGYAQLAHCTREIVSSLDNAKDDIEKLMWKIRMNIAYQCEKFERNYIERSYEAINPTVQQGDKP